MSEDVEPRQTVRRSRAGYFDDIALVLDATEVHRDWLLHAAGFRLLAHYVRERGLTVYIPAPVIAETVANYERECADLARRVQVLDREARRLRAGSLGPIEPIPYRAALHQALEAYGFEVLPWPTVGHDALVERAATRTPPFDATGSGYRDALTWHSILELAGAGHEVALISSDGDFRESKGGELADALRREAETQGLRVALFRTIDAWLFQAEPHPTSIRDAAASARDEGFIDYLQQVDFLGELWLEPEDLGFPPGAVSDDGIQDAFLSWWDRTGGPTERDGRFVVEYALHSVTRIGARVTMADAQRNGWTPGETDPLDDLVFIDEEVPFTVSLEAVFTEHDQLDEFSVVGITSRVTYRDLLAYPAPHIDGQMELELDGQPLVAD